MSESNSDKPNVQEIMARIRREVKESAAGQAPVAASTTGAPQPGASKVSPVLYSEDLNYLNAHRQDWREALEIKSHRRFFGPLIVRLKRYIIDILYKSLLQVYFDREARYHYHLVRFLNSTARYIDARDAEIFWQIVNKIDSDIGAVNERMDRLFDEGSASLANQEAVFKKRIAEVEAVCRQLTQKLSAEQGITIARSNGSYQQLFRTGPRSQETLQAYARYFQGCPGVVVDLSCGAGLFIGALRDAGREVFGVDKDEEQLNRCRERGLNVSQSSHLEYLEQLARDAVGGIFLSRSSLDLAYEEAARIVGLSAERIKDGGKLGLEFIVPENVAGDLDERNRYWEMRKRMNPQTVSALLEEAGFTIEAIVSSSLAAQGDLLQPLEWGAALPLKWQEILTRFNENVAKLNELLFGLSSFCVIAAAKRRALDIEAEGAAAGERAGLLKPSAKADEPVSLLEEVR